MPKISRVGRLNDLHTTWVSHVFLVVYCQISSISFPVALEKGNVGNEVSGFREKNRLPYCFLLDISLIFPLMWFFLLFTPSLACSQTLYFLFKVRRARAMKYKPQGIYWPALNVSFSERKIIFLFSHGKCPIFFMRLRWRTQGKLILANFRLKIRAVWDSDIENQSSDSSHK